MNFHKKLKGINAHLRKWNKETFRNIDHNIAKLEAKVDDVDRRMEDSENDETLVARHAALTSYLQ